MAGDTRTLIATAVTRFGDEVPALRSLKLVIRLQLRARGDAQVWRIELPGPEVKRDPARDARVDVSVSRSHFNELVRDGRLQHWVDAFNHGHVKVSGDSAVVKLVGSVVERQHARAR